MNSHITEFLNEVKRTRSNSTCLQYSSRLAMFNLWLPNKPVWTRKLITDYLYNLQDMKVAQSSIVQMQSTLSAFYSFLVSDGILEANPLKGSKKIAQKANSAPKLVFTENEYVCLKDQAKGHWWGAAIQIAWHTGLRLADIALLKWEEVSMADHAIRLNPQKTERHGKSVEIPMSPRFFEWIQHWFAPQPNTGPFKYVLPEMAAHYLADGNKSLSSQFGRMLKKCGIVGKSFHSFRHTYVTRMLAAGMSVAMLSTITGQSIQVISRHYNHISLDDKKKFLENLEKTA